MSSALISAGVVGYLAIRQASPGEAAAEEAERALSRDTATPERAAEAFLDAWRKRDLDRAAALSRGVAREAVLRRKSSAEEFGPEAADLQKTWETLAESRLTLHVQESETLPGGKLALRGTAEGEFLARPYRRLMEFLLSKDGERWLVDEMNPGEILTETPPLLDPDAGDRPNPAELKERPPPPR